MGCLIEKRDGYNGRLFTIIQVSNRKVSYMGFRVVETVQPGPSKLDKSRTSHHPLWGKLRRGERGVAEAGLASSRPKGEQL